MLPLFLRRVHGAAFIDAALVASNPLDMLEGSRFAGLGAELRLDVLLGYALTVDIRLGLARGFGEEGDTLPFLVLGGSF